MHPCITNVQILNVKLQLLNKISNWIIFKFCK